MQQKHTFSNQKERTTPQNKHKITKARFSRFRFPCFINLSLTYLLRHLPTYLQPRDIHGSLLMQLWKNNVYRLAYGRWNDELTEWDVLRQLMQVVKVHQLAAELHATTTETTPFVNSTTSLGLRACSVLKCSWMKTATQDKIGQFRGETGWAGSLPSLKQTSSEQWWLSGGQEGKLSGLFCAVLCATIVHSELHTHTNRTNSCLDWVLSHWAHFNVLRFVFVYALFCVLYIACMCSIVT